MIWKRVSKYAVISGCALFISKTFARWFFKEFKPGNLLIQNREWLPCYKFVLN